jgi:hypothetical protein
LGFPLIETRTMVMSNRSSTTNEFVTTLETLEFSTVKLDSMLFEIPIGYKETKKMEDLQEPYDASAYMKMQEAANNSNSAKTVNPSDAKKSGVTRIAVLEPTGESTLQAASLQQYMVGLLGKKNVEAIAVSSAAQAKEYHCDLLLNTEFVKVKPGSKVGGLIKAIKNTDPNATSSFNIEAVMTLTNVADGSSKGESKVNGKFDGKVDEAAKRAVEKGCGEILDDL